MPGKPASIPTVFISSTVEDLERFRAAARDAVVGARCLPDMQEYFVARDHPPLAECLERVARADVLVAIVAHRYGWVPADQPGGGCKSITWLEVEHAAGRNKEVLAFLVEEGASWEEESKEEYELVRAAREGRVLEVAATVQRNVEQLGKFKAWLNGRGIRGTFTNPEDLRGKVQVALLEWRQRHPEFGETPAGPEAPEPDPARYLAWLHEQTARIDIRGLEVGRGTARSFPIDELYIPLTTSVGEERRSVRLEEALAHQKLVIVGDPGSGKTTFLRRIAFELCRRLLGESGETVLPLPVAGFPLLIRIAELEEHIEKFRRTEGAPANRHSPAWLAHFLGTRSREHEWGLGEEFFLHKLRSKSTALLLDGLDEAPNRVRREDMARLFEAAKAAYSQCYIVVTTRPATYSGQTTLAGFREVRVDELGTEAVDAFLGHWSRSLFRENALRAEKHHRELGSALRARLEIRRMARNPLMLTALAVVHWNERRLPEQRAELYESIVTWLARAREQRPGRVSADRCLELLGHLALGMQSKVRGRVTQVEKGLAAAMVAGQFQEAGEAERFGLAQRFLDEEEVDSGIVVSRGAEVRFWHLTFQEHLAARAVAGFSEADQLKLLFDQDRLYRPEWREVVLLLAGILLVKQGRGKVDGLFQAALDRLGSRKSLSDRVRCAGLLGAILGDLRSLAYRPPDQRYDNVRESVWGIFEEREAVEVDFRERLKAWEALGQVGDPRLRGDNWVTIPAGRFLMGAQSKDAGKPNYDSAAKNDEGPVKEVWLEAFQIGRYPVTVEEYHRFIEDNDSQNPEFWKSGGYGKKRKPVKWEDQLLHPNRPIVHLSWYEAAAYCAWAGGRLPSEAEWERAARGNEGWRYPWGNEPPDPSRANYNETHVGSPTPVGLFRRGMTPEGICDLAGNVWEWVADWYEKGKTRCVRGGSWNSRSSFLRASNRHRDGPEHWNDYIGFRCAREIPSVPGRH